ncbi:hypothetical protein, partial [uncultured Lacinutrix sp.]|uniref:hypothetical protein n=1 Tax=uncultured Lacinutrix sp. TaxID=574032 RepID=UPI002603B37F
IPITDDTIDEADETFTVDGTVTSGNTSNTDPSGTVTITDNDLPLCPSPVDTDGDGLTDCEETTGIDDPSTTLDP